MESVFILEKKIISLTFNSIKDTSFILYSQSDNLDLVEESLSTNVIIKRFRLLDHKNFITNKLKEQSYEGLSLYFWEYSKKLVLTYSSGYLSIYNSDNAKLEWHFQPRGKYPYIVRNFIGSPTQNSFFFSAQDMINVYHCNLDQLMSFNVSDLNSKVIKYNKLVLEKNFTVFDIICHPNEKFIFIAGSNSAPIRVFDYLTFTQVLEIKENENNNSEFSTFTLDINSYGNILLSGSESGYMYLWDALDAIKSKRTLLCRYRFSSIGILSAKFLKMKQFENLDRILCLTCEGKIYISNTVLQSVNKEKIISFNKLYENNIYDEKRINYSKVNVLPTNYLSISQISNFICIKWPNDLYFKHKDYNDIVIFDKFYAKFLFIYDNIYPKINFPSGSAFLYPNYTDIIPRENKKVAITFEQYIYSCDSNFIFQYCINSGINKKFIHYSKEFNLKNILVLKFDVRPKRKRILPTDKLYLAILIQNENNQKSTLLIELGGSNTSYAIENTKKFEDTNDFIMLGLEEENLEHLLLLHKNKQIAIFYDLKTKLVENKSIEGSIQRMYKTPFVDGYCIIYRNVLNQLKFSENISLSDLHFTDKNNVNEVKMINNFSNFRQNSIIEEIDLNKTTSTILNKFSYKNENGIALALEFNEREIDICFNIFKYESKNQQVNKFTNIDTKDFGKQNYLSECLCAISMIEKVLICNHNLVPVYQIKITLLENPNIISSLYWVGKTLIYTRGNDVCYYYPNDNLNYKLFTNDQCHTQVAGVMSDRFILISKIWASTKLITINITTPLISPLEIILIGYLDLGIHVDYDIVKDCVLNLFTNQISENLLKKFKKRNLHNIILMFIKDNKTSFINTSTKLEIRKSCMDYDDPIIESIFPLIDFNNKFQIEELMWKFEYEHNFDQLKKLLMNEANSLIQIGLFDEACLILELINEYPKVINLISITRNYNDFISNLKVLSEKNKLSYSELVLLLNMFVYESSEKKRENDIKKLLDLYSNQETSPHQQKLKTMENKNDKIKYSKIFDTYKGDPLTYDLLKSGIPKTNKSSFDIYKNFKKSESNVPNINRKILSFGENPYEQYVEIYNGDTKSFELLPINHVLSQKITHYYGYSNVVDEKIIQKRNRDFYDNSNPLSDNLSNEKTDKLDDSIDQNADEINESSVIVAYLRCDKGNGIQIEDITENNNEGIMSVIVQDNSLDMNKLIWSKPLEENNPLELDDKWGRKSAQSHSLKFKKEIKSSLKIRSNDSFKGFSNHFTIEFWMKLSSLDCLLLKKEALSIKLNSGNVIVEYSENSIQLDKFKLNTYSTINIDNWLHFCCTYRKKSGLLTIYLMSELAYQGKIILNEGFGLLGDFIFGEGKLDGLLTEIRLWNQCLPIKIIKENMKCPLAILSERKRRIEKVKIKQNNETKEVKKFGQIGKSFSKYFFIRFR